MCWNDQPISRKLLHQELLTMISSANLKRNMHYVKLIEFSFFHNVHTFFMAYYVHICMTFISVWISFHYKKMINHKGKSYVFDLSERCQESKWMIYFNDKRIDEYQWFYKLVNFHNNARTSSQRRFYSSLLSIFYKNIFLSSMQ